jgi:hypothetical protein
MCRIFGLVTSVRRSESDKDIEIMVLRHQVRILECQLHALVRYRPADRAILAGLSRLLPRTQWRSYLVTPETLLRWHRDAAKRRWRQWRSQRGPGRPPMSDELVGLVVRLGRANRRWGCIRTQGEPRTLPCSAVPPVPAPPTSAASLPLRTRMSTAKEVADSAWWMPTERKVSYRCQSQSGKHVPGLHTRFPQGTARQ